jgi:hypothetical protein
VEADVTVQTDSLPFVLQMPSTESVLPVVLLRLHLAQPVVMSHELPVQPLPVQNLAPVIEQARFVSAPHEQLLHDRVSLYPVYVVNVVKPPGQVVVDVFSEHSLNPLGTTGAHTCPDGQPPPVAASEHVSPWLSVTAGVDVVFAPLHVPVTVVMLWAEPVQ